MYICIMYIHSRARGGDLSGNATSWVAGRSIERPEIGEISSKSVWSGFSNRYRERDVPARRCWEYHQHYSGRNAFRMERKTVYRVTISGIGILLVAAAAGWRPL